MRSWSNLTQRLGRWTRPDATANNPLIEQPRETAAAPPPVGSDLPEPVKPESTSIFDKVKQPKKNVGTRYANTVHEFHDHKTIKFKISPRKLNKIAKQVRNSALGALRRRG